MMMMIWEHGMGIPHNSCDIFNDDDDGGEP